MSNLTYTEGYFSDNKMFRETNVEVGLPLASYGLSLYYTLCLIDLVKLCHIKRALILFKDESKETPSNQIYEIRFKVNNDLLSVCSCEHVIKPFETNLFCSLVLSY